GPPGGAHYRISIRIEPHGAAGAYLDGHIRAGDVLDVSEPRGGFTLLPGDRPVALVSAGIGATPVLAMLHALAASASPREVWWLHGARNGRADAFAEEVRRLLGSLAHARSHVRYSQPDAGDRPGQAYDAVGHLDAAVLEDLRVPRDADIYL